MKSFSKELLETVIEEFKTAAPLIASQAASIGKFKKEFFDNNKEVIEYALDEYVERLAMLQKKLEGKFDDETATRILLEYVKRYESPIDKGVDGMVNAIATIVGGRIQQKYAYLPNSEA
jgi:hypothetical protein